MPLHSRKPARRLPPDRRVQRAACTCRRRPRQSPLPHLLVPDLTGWRCRCGISLLQRGGGCRRKGRDRLRTGKAFEKQGYMTETVRHCAPGRSNSPVSGTSLPRPNRIPRLASRPAKGRVPSRRSGRSPMAEPVKPGCHPENTEGRSCERPSAFSSIRNRGSGIPAFRGAGPTRGRKNCSRRPAGSRKVIRASP